MMKKITLRLSKTETQKLFMGSLLALTVATLHAQTIPIWTLSQSAFIAQNPSQGGSVSVYLIENFHVSSNLVGSAMYLPTETSVSYAIPYGQHSFTGILAYSATDNVGDSEQSYNRVRIQILVDGTQVFDAGLDKNTPPEQFTVPLGTGKVLTLVTSDEWGYDRAYLVNAGFNPTTSGLSSSYLPASGVGFIDVYPQTRQSLFDVFRPGEAVAARAYFGSSATSASVTIKVAPESGASPVSSTFQVPLSHSGSGPYSGAFTWAVPSLRGPAHATLQEIVNGSTVFSTSIRIAIAPAVDVTYASNSPFGIAMGSSGVGFAQDELASLWGAKWTRVFVRWDLVEKVQGQYDFAGMDQLINIYAQQHMPILAVLEEAAFPSWASTPGTAQYAALNQFAKTTVARYKGKIETWEDVNEPDNKYRLIGGTGNVDEQWISNVVAGVKSADASATNVCCATGASSGDFLSYDKRIFDAGYLANTNVVSMHAYAYRNTPPELIDGAYNFPGRVNALLGLIQRYNTSKPIWVTEANYLIGPPGVNEVNAPGMSEHTQALYDVRVNLMAFGMGVKYFLEMPVFTVPANYIHVDTLSAYANMASFFTNAKLMKPLSFGTNDIYAVVGQSGNNLVGAVWTSRPLAQVQLNGLSGVQFFDFYGNPISGSTGDLSISGTPIYFQASSFNAPFLTVLNETPIPPWIAMPPLMSWIRTSTSTYQQQGSAVEVTSNQMNFNTQFESQPISILPNSCYIFDVSLLLQQGAIAWGVIDPSTHQWAGPPVGLYAFGATQPDEAQYRLDSNNYTSVQLAITGWNSPLAAVSQFQASQPRYRLCAESSNGY